VRAHEAERGDLVKQPVARARETRERREMQEAERADAVVERDDDDVAARDRRRAS
jgi:hypothetical protein